MILAPYAAVACCLQVTLSLRVITLRRALKIALGDDGDERLQRAVRAQANCAEYLPLALLLLALLELGGGAAWWIHGLSVTLLLGRLLHAVGVSQTREDFRLRVSGMALNLSSLLLAALALLLAI